MFLGFANFYQQFILGFRWIAAPLISILKTSESTESKTWAGEGKVEVGGNRAGRGGSKLDKSKLDGGEIDDDKVDNEFGKKGQKTSKSKSTIGSSNFLIPRAKLAFTKLRQAFFKAPILYHFDPEHHIRIETDVSGYAIGEVLS